METETHAWAVVIRWGMEPGGEWFVLPNTVASTRGGAINRYCDDMEDGRQFYAKHRKRGVLRASRVRITSWSLPDCPG